MSDVDLDDLRAELKEFAQPQKQAKYTAREERIIAGFEEIQRFVDEHGREPRHGEGLDIFERLYAVRLDQLRQLDEAQELLAELDHQGLLSEAGFVAEALTVDELASELAGVGGAAAISELKHVRSNAEKRVPDEIANREECKDFDRFAALFEQVKREVAEGLRETVRFQEDIAIKRGQWFIVEGQIALVADMGEVFINAQGREDARLRVVYDNRTESNLLLRSLQRALHRDPTGRRILEPSQGPLFSGESDEDDVATGTIYVLRSKSDHPDVVANRDLLHKIGVTSGELGRRFADARHEPTFLMADVEVVASYRLANVNRTRLERLIHRVFATARLEIQITDRFGEIVTPREWFLVPLFVIEEAVERIRDGSIVEYVYEPGRAELVRVEG